MAHLPSGWILTANAVSYLTQLILVSTVIAVLLRKARATTGTRLLIAAFFGLAGYFVCNLAFAVTPSDWGRPTQYLFLFVAMAAFLQFAYRVPQPPAAAGDEATAVLYVSSGAVLGGVAQVLVFLSRKPGWFERTRAVSAVLLAIEFLWVILVFLRRSVDFSLAQTAVVAKDGDASRKRRSWSTVWSALRSPSGESARIARSFALVTSSGLAVACWAVVQHAVLRGPRIVPYDVYLLGLHLGTLLCIFSVALVFLTYTPEPVRLADRLSLSTLVMVLAVAAVLGQTLLMIRETEYDQARAADVQSVARALTRSGESGDPDPSDIPPLVQFVLARPSSSSTTAAETLRFLRPGLDAVLPDGAAPTPKRIMRSSRIGLFILHTFRQNDREFLVGFPRRALQDHLNTAALPVALGTMASAVFVLAIAPFFYRASLVRPLNRLLEGVASVNQGQREVVVPVEHNDEIGFLTQSFNGMVASIARADRVLQEVNAELEERVRARTAELSRSNLALTERASELASSNAELDAFARTVAHDLKNPLAVILAHCELLTMPEFGVSPEHLTASLRQIEQASVKTNSIIDEILLLATLRRKEDLLLEPVAMGTVVDAALYRLNDMVGEYGATLMVPEAWPTVLGHAPWIEEVWVNYLSNALKYGGSPPHVELGATVEAEKARFWVHDNGPGLSSAERERLFVPFERLGQVRTEGHGLGLSITRRIVETLGGSVSVDSAGVAGEGCTFSFVLPLA